MGLETYLEERFYPGLRSVRTEARVRGNLKAWWRRSQVPCVSELESAHKDLGRPSGMP